MKSLDKNSKEKGSFNDERHFNEPKFNRFRCLPVIHDTRYHHVPSSPCRYLPSQLEASQSFCGPYTEFVPPPYDNKVVFDEYGFDRWQLCNDVHSTTHNNASTNFKNYTTPSEKYAEKFQSEANRRAFRWKKFYKEDPSYKNKKQLKFLIRKGIPNELRAEVWAHCLGSKVLLDENPDVYLKYAQSDDINERTLHQIDLDINRTFPTNQLFRSQRGLAKLRRVLCAFAAFDPEVNYCQSMNFLAGILLVFMKEDLAFWSLVQLINNRLLPSKGMNLSNYYSDSMKGLRCDLKILKTLMKHRTPRALEKLQSFEIELEWICSEWFLCLFSTSLPLRTTLRVWDVLMNEGRKILFRISLTLFKQFELVAHHYKSLEDIMTYFKSSLQEIIVDHNTLLNNAFYGIRFFSRVEINKLAILYKVEVEKEDAERAERRRAKDKLKELKKLQDDSNDSIKEATTCYNNHHHRYYVSPDSPIPPMSLSIETIALSEIPQGTSSSEYSSTERLMREEDITTPILTTRCNHDVLLEDNKKYSRLEQPDTTENRMHHTAFNDKNDDDYDEYDDIIKKQQNNRTSNDIKNKRKVDIKDFEEHIENFRKAFVSVIVNNSKNRHQRPVIQQRQNNRNVKHNTEAKRSASNTQTHNDDSLTGSLLQTNTENSRKLPIIEKEPAKKQEDFFFSQLISDAFEIQEEVTVPPILSTDCTQQMSAWIQTVFKMCTLCQKCVIGKSNSFYATSMHHANKEEEHFYADMIISLLLSYATLLYAKPDENKYPTHPFLEWIKQGNEWELRRLPLQEELQKLSFIQLTANPDVLDEARPDHAVCSCRLEAMTGTSTVDDLVAATAINSSPSFRQRGIDVITNAFDPWKSSISPHNFK